MKQIPHGQFNIEISSIDSNNRMTIKQYQLFPDQLRMLTRKIVNQAIHHRFNILIIMGVSVILQITLIK